MPERLLYTPAEAAELLSLSRATIYVLMTNGELESVMVGRSRRITHDALQDFIGRLKRAS